MEEWDGSSPRNLRKRKGTDGQVEPQGMQPKPPQKADMNLLEMHHVEQEEMNEVVLGMESLLFHEDVADEEDSLDDSEMPLPQDEDEESSSEEADDSSTEVGHPPEDDDDPMETEDNEGPITWVRDQFREYTQKAENYLDFEDDEKTSIRLLDVLKLKKAPLNSHRQLLQWHYREKGWIHQAQPVSECSDYLSRKVVFKRLNRRYNMLNKHPFTKLVKLPISGAVVKLCMHEPGAVLQGLLTDPRIKDADYLFHDANPLAPPPEKHRVVNDVNTGKAYRNTHKVLIDPSKREQLVPLVLYIDGSAITHFHDMELTQVRVSLGIWSQKARLKSYAWGTLGYIEKVHNEEGFGQKIWEGGQHVDLQDANEPDSEEEKCEVLPGVGDHNNQDLHAQIKAIMGPLKKYLLRGILWDQAYKGKLYRDCHYKFFIPFVKCDNSEANKLCGKYNVGHGIKMICRSCKVPLDETDDHLHECRYKTEDEIKKMVERGDLQWLQAHSQQYLLNAFHDLPFNKGNKRGIHGACPIDMLHTVQLGVFSYIRDIFFHQIGGVPARVINGLSKQFCKCFGRQSDRTIPQARFSKGIKEGKLMGRDYRGILLLMLVILLSAAGKKVLKKASKGKFKEDMFIQDWTMLVELLLLWEAYLCLPEMEVRSLRKLERKTRYLMYLMRKVAPREEGVHWKVMKFHALLHIVEEILLYGVPLETDTSANESHHKPTKAAAKMTQMAHATFNIQTARRLVEFALIELAMLEIQEGLVLWRYYEGLEEVDQDDHGTDEEDGGTDGEGVVTDAEGVPPPLDGAEAVESVPGGTQIRVFWDDESQTTAFQVLGRSVHKDKGTMPAELIDILWRLQNFLADDLDGNDLQIYTKVKRGGQIWRGHPNYRGKGPWRDWAWVDYGRDGEFLCHMWCFVDIPPLRGGTRRNFEGTMVEEGVFAVVEVGELEEEEEHNLTTTLVQPMTKRVKLDEEGQQVEKTFHLADTAAFAQPCFAVPDIGGAPNRYYIVHPRDDWPGLFKDWLDSPMDDDMDMDDTTENAK